jgi:hypothetical protein
LLYWLIDWLVHGWTGWSGDWRAGLPINGCIGRLLGRSTGGWLAGWLIGRLVDRWSG